MNKNVSNGTFGEKHLIEFWDLTSSFWEWSNLPLLGPLRWKTSGRLPRSDVRFLRMEKTVSARTFEMEDLLSTSDVWQNLHKPLYRPLLGRFQACAYFIGKNDIITMTKSSQVWRWQWRNHIFKHALSVVTAIDYDSVEVISIYGTRREIILEFLKSSLAGDYS